MSDKHTAAHILKTSDGISPFRKLRPGTVEYAVALHAVERALLFRATEGQAQTSAAEMIDCLKCEGRGRYAVMSDGLCIDGRCAQCNGVGKVRSAQSADSTAPGAPVEAILSQDCGHDIGPARQGFYEGVRGSAKIVSQWAMGVRAALESIACGWDGCNAHGIESGKGHDVGADLRRAFAALDLPDAAPTAQQSLTTGGAVPVLSQERIFELADEHSSGVAPSGNYLVRRMRMLDLATAIERDIRAQLAAAPLPQVQSEALWTPDEIAAAHPQCKGLKPPCKVDCPCWREGQGATNQQPVTPSGAPTDNDGGVK